MNISDLTAKEGIFCTCGKTHFSGIDDVVIGSGALKRLPEIVRRYTSGRVFVLADPNTFAAAGKLCCGILKDGGIDFSLFVFESGCPAPNEETVGSAVMNFDTGCELILGIGSGVVNDTGKLLSRLTGKPYVIAATAPSMDGYASATSSMERGGLKTSIPSVCPNVVVGDTDVLKNAPLPMLRAGLGDMLAKYVSVCEWRIAHIVTGEYYCEYISGLVRSSLEKCLKNAGGLLSRRDDAVEAVFEGLVVCGLAMSFAGLSRPASGVEHYFSHIWDMRALEFGTPAHSHGVQCALGTLLAVKLYEKLKAFCPDRERAFSAVESFDKNAWNGELRRLLGRGAEAMIALETRENKYDPQRHAERFETIASRWDEILDVISRELPCPERLEKLMDSLGLPVAPAALGLDEEIGTVFSATKDIRDKYVLSRLVWDLGLSGEISPENL